MLKGYQCEVLETRDKCLSLLFSLVNRTTALPVATCLLPSCSCLAVYLHSPPLWSNLVTGHVDHVTCLPFVFPETLAFLLRDAFHIGHHSNHHFLPHTAGHHFHHLNLHQGIHFLHSHIHQPQVGILGM